MALVIVLAFSDLSCPCMLLEILNKISLFFLDTMTLTKETDTVVTYRMEQ